MRVGVTPINAGRQQILARYDDARRKLGGLDEADAVRVHRSAKTLQQRRRRLTGGKRIERRIGEVPKRRQLLMCAHCDNLTGIK
jgi:hypothetical protein